MEVDGHYLFNAINANPNMSPALPQNNSPPSSPSVPTVSPSEMSTAQHPHSPSSTSPSNDACSNNNTTARSSNAFFVRSHLAIISATQSNIGCRYHRQKDARRAMEWYLESIQTRAALYALPPPSKGVDNSNCNRDDRNEKTQPSPPHPKRRRVSNRNTTNNSRSHDGPASSQHDTSNADDANLLVKYLHEATAIEAIEASSHPQNPQGFDIAQHEHGEVGNDDGNASDSDYEDDDYDATFGSLPLDEDEEEELSSFLRSNDIVSADNNLSTDTTSRFIGLNHFTSPITIDLSKGMMKTAASQQQDHQHDGDNNNKSSAYECYEYDVDAHAAITLFNMSILRQQDGTDLDTCRRYLDVGLHLLTQQASLSKSPLHICLAIMLHTNLGYISCISDDNDWALRHFTVAFSIVCHAVERTFKDIESTEKRSGSPSNEYLQSKRACHYYYCRAEVAALINIARSCEADGQYEIALRACTSAIQRLQSNPSLLDGGALPFCTVQSAIDADHQAFEEQLTLSNTFGSGKNSSSLDLNSAMFAMASINSQLANDEEALRYYVAYFHHVTDRHGPDHPHATAAILGINLIQLLTRGRMSLAAGAA